MLKDLVLLGIGALFGLGATMAALAAPAYYPHTPLWVWHSLFWGGIALMTLMLADVVLLFFWKPSVLAAILFNLGGISVAAAIIVDTSSFNARSVSSETPISQPTYAGVLVPKEEKLLFSPTEGGLIPKMQIGESNVFIVGPSSPYAATLLPALKESQLKVESVDGKMKVSARIVDGSSNLMAELIRNEWKVAPQPHTWDRNYSNDALEVKDPSGRIVLQVRVLSDRIQIQGLWWIDMGPPNGMRQLIVRQNPEEITGAQLVIVPKDTLDTPPIRARFEYPSELHLGELSVTK
jgi:hypothetical protein